MGKGKHWTRKRLTEQIKLKQQEIKEKSKQDDNKER
jgi:hypothetical protein